MLAHLKLFYPERNWERALKSGKIRFAAKSCDSEDWEIHFFGKNFEDKMFLKNLKLIKDEKFHLKLKSRITDHLLQSL